MCIKITSLELIAVSIIDAELIDYYIEAFIEIDWILDNPRTNKCSILHLMYIPYVLDVLHFHYQKRCCYCFLSKINNDLYVRSIG